MNGTPKSTRGAQSREQILTAAVTLFARQGYHRTGLRELAGAAGVNLAMINYFFGSKKNLLLEILDTFFTGYLEVAEKGLTGPEDPRLKLERFISLAVGFFTTHHDFLLIAITDLHQEDPDISEYKASWGNRLIKIMDQEICLPLAARTGREISPKLVFSLLTSMMASRFLFAPVMNRVENGSTELPGPEDYSEAITGIFLRGLTGQENQ